MHDRFVLVGGLTAYTRVLYCIEELISVQPTGRNPLPAVLKMDEV